MIPSSQKECRTDPFARFRAGPLPPPPSTGCSLHDCTPCRGALEQRENVSREKREVPEGCVEGAAVELGPISCGRAPVDALGDTRDLPEEKHQHGMRHKRGEPLHIASHICCDRLHKLAHAAGELGTQESDVSKLSSGQARPILASIARQPGWCQVIEIGPRCDAPCPWSQTCR